MTSQEQIKKENAGKIQGKVGKGRPPIETRFKKGQSGNPKGKPIGAVSVVAALKRKLVEIPQTESNKEKRSYLEMLIIKILKKALTDEDVGMIKDIIDRVDGKPPQKIQGDLDNPLFPDKIKIEFKKK